ncbi:hypothetical protein PVAND_005775 [Polypedilum vanderplanki]|uniref:Zinc finger protein n=1 Tax=Polypedilum vanderplanki TaxID=319348 RepID=A0A9J6C166_POLVA|nr:hypothetical protein PVAND_005775 [Polypedilum vanderplanki]
MREFIYCIPLFSLIDINLINFLIAGDDEEFPNEESAAAAATQQSVQHEESEEMNAAEEQSSHSEPSKTNTPSPDYNENIELNEQHRKSFNGSNGEKRSLTRSRSDSLSPIPKTKIISGLRLNAALASDPATNPDAKEILNLHIKSEDSKTHDGDDDDDVDHHEFINHNEDTESIIEAVSIPKQPLPLNLQSPQHHHQQTSQKAKENINNVNQMLVKNLEIIPRQNVFMCQPCGIRFSSLSTLEAHQTYYCSHRKDADENNQKSSNNSNDINGSEPPTKAIKTGKQYACTQCSYSADKKVSLNRHMRMHQTSPAPSSTTSNGDDPPASQNQIIVPQIIGPPTQQIIDRYCSDCDIRFSSTKTYRAHKQHYCSSRHQGQSTPAILPPAIISATTPKSSSKSESQTPPEETAKTPPSTSQPFLAIPTNPIIIIPYSLIRNASIIPGPLSSAVPVSNPESACFMLQNGTLQPIAYSLNPTATSTTPNSQSQLSQQQQQTQASRTPHSHNETTSTATKTCKPSGSNTSGNEVLKAINKRDGIANRESATTPLDLSIRRMSPASNSRERSLSLSSAISAEHFRMEFDTMMEGKENLSVSGESSVTPEQIVCAPSLPGSPPLTPSRRSNSPRGSSVSMSPNSSTSHSILMRPLLPTDIALRLSDPTLNVIPPLVKQSMELALRLSTTSTNEATNTQPQISPSQPIASSTTPTQIPPQIFVKTGMSKCKECNIVFCKYENYVAHKKHYCSARNTEENEGGNSAKVSPPLSPPTASPSATQTYQQLICMACGIKFASLDNLNAHQMYYCPKRNELQAQTSSIVAAVAAPTAVTSSSSSSHKEKCTKCKSVHDPSQVCTVAGQGAYKCPICEVISPNSSEARRHMETHGGVKAFRCTICRYKGNTLRGMRTHIRMHIDKKTSDVNEENYISCILDDDSTEIPPLNASKIPSPHIVNNEVNHTVLKSSKLTSPEIEPSEIVIEKNVIKTEPEEMEEEASKESRENVKSPIAPNTLVKVEIEEEDVEIADNDPKLSPPLPPRQLIISPSHKTTSPNDMSRNISPVASSNQSINSTTPPIVSPNGSKYCSNCDISFTYTHTFIAHKKFYCKGKNGDRPMVANSPNPSSNVVNVTLAAESVL